MKRLIVSVILLAVAATACADVTQPAIEVNGESIGRGEMIDLIVDLRPANAPDEPGTLDCQARDTAVEASILNILISDEIARRGGAINAEDLEAGRFAADQQIVSAGNFTEDARPMIEGLVSVQTALTRLAENEDPAALFERLITDADVTVDSRFGSWIDGLGYEPIGPCGF